MLKCFRLIMIKMIHCIFFSRETYRPYDRYIYLPHCRHDLESFVKMFYLLSIPEEKEAFENDEDLHTRIKCAHDYWQSFTNKAPTFWIEALGFAREDELEKLYDHLKQFPMFKIDYFSENKNKNQAEDDNYKYVSDDDDDSD